MGNMYETAHPLRIWRGGDHIRPFPKGGPENKHKVQFPYEKYMRHPVIPSLKLC